MQQLSSVVFCRPKKLQFVIHYTDIQVDSTSANSVVNVFSTTTDNWMVVKMHICLFRKITHMFLLIHNAAKNYMQYNITKAEQ